MLAADALLSSGDNGRTWQPVEAKSFPGGWVHTLRNGRLTDSISLADRTISDQQNMASSSKGRRLLVAYKVKATARTKLYDGDAKKNSGFGDERLLNYAIMAWEEVRNYARGIKDSAGVDKANVEITDLEGRRSPK